MTPPSMPPASAAMIEAIQKEADAIEADPTAGARWGALHKLMLKAKIPPGDAARLIVGRDLEGVRALLRMLKGESIESDATPAATDATDKAAAPDVDPSTMKAAMRAFRKRLKVTRLDHESRLGTGPLTGGKAHEVDAILPPRDFDIDVWRALVASGKLRDVGRGFYALAEEFESDG